MKLSNKMLLSSGGFKPRLAYHGTGRTGKLRDFLQITEASLMKLIHLFPSAYKMNRIALIQNDMSSVSINTKESER